MDGNILDNTLWGYCFWCRYQSLTFCPKKGRLKPKTACLWWSSSDEQFCHSKSNVKRGEQLVGQDPSSQYESHEQQGQATAYSQLPDREDHRSTSWSAMAGTRGSLLWGYLRGSWISSTRGLHLGLLVCLTDLLQPTIWRTFTCS